MDDALHRPDARLTELVVEHIVRRQRDGAPLGRTATGGEMQAALAAGIPRHGRGPDAAWELFTDAVSSRTVGLDSTRFLAFIPMAPSTAAVWMDAVVGASSFSAESWLEAAGAVAAENQVLEWLRDLIGMPEGTGGAFCSGGSLGNLSALAVARSTRAGRRRVAVADTAHASVGNALALLSLEPLVVPTGPDGRFTGHVLHDHLHALGIDHRSLAAVVASGGSTNAGVVDDIAGLADLAHDVGAWLHVDAAYGGAALLLEEERPRFAGLRRADSVIIDPHKWLFATGGSCAVLYRDPDAARSVHTQHGPYVDALHVDGAWNPSDLAFQLTRRASGLPLWFALQVHGVEAHAAAVRRGIELARYAAASIAATSVAEPVQEPEMSVVLIRRDGWGTAEWSEWARRLLREGIAFVAPTTWRGEPVGRLVFLNPGTTEAVVDEVVATLVDDLA